MGRELGNRRVKYSYCCNEIFALLPTILLYKENEAFDDAEVLIVSLKFLCFDALIYIKVKDKDYPKLEDPVIRE